MLGDGIHGGDVFVSQANICEDPAVIHLSRIDDAIGGKDCVGDIHRSAVEGAQACVIPTDIFNGSFHSVRTDPVPLLKRTVEEQHETGEEVLGDVLRSEGEADSSAAAHSGEGSGWNTEGDHECASTNY